MHLIQQLIRRRGYQRSSMLGNRLIRCQRLTSSWCSRDRRSRRHRLTRGHGLRPYRHLGFSPIQCRRSIRNWLSEQYQAIRFTRRNGKPAFLMHGGNSPIRYQQLERHFPNRCRLTSRSMRHRGYTPSWRHGRLPIHCRHSQPNYRKRFIRQSSRHILAGKRIIRIMFPALLFHAGKQNKRNGGM